MAEENEDTLFNDINDETESGGGVATKDDDDDDDLEVEDDERDSDDELCRDCTAEAAELGIVIPDDITNCKDWMQHFLTSIKTHKATKATAAAGGAPATAESGGEAPTEESPMMMSRLRIDKHHDPVTRALGKEREEEIKGRRLKRLKRLEESGIFPPAMLNELRNRSSVVRLSLIGSRFVADGTVDAEINALYKTLENINGLGHGKQLSLLKRAKAHANPLDAIAKEDAEAAEQLTTRSERNSK